MIWTVIFNPVMVLMYGVIFCYWCILVYEHFSPFNFKMVMNKNTEEVVKEKYNDNYYVVPLEDWRLLSFSVARNIIKDILSEGNPKPFSHCTINGFVQSPTSVYFVFNSKDECEKWTSFIKTSIKTIKSDIEKKDLSETWSLV